MVKKYAQSADLYQHAFFRAIVLRSGCATSAAISVVPLSARSWTKPGIDHSTWCAAVFTTDTCSATTFRAARTLTPPLTLCLEADRTSHLQRGSLLESACPLPDSASRADT